MIGFTIASNLSSRNQPYTDRQMSIYFHVQKGMLLPLKVYTYGDKA